MKIKEIIVVEGKNDTNVLQSYFDCETIETHGTHLGKEILRQIKIAKEKRGIIIFTDPDYPGEKIRHTINSKIPGCKNAYIEKSKAKTTKKVGVEHANKEDLYNALKNTFTYVEDFKESITWEEFITLGLNGSSEASKKRFKIATLLHLGKPNAKTLFKRLNMLQITKQDIIHILESEEATC